MCRNAMRSTRKQLKQRNIYNQKFGNTTRYNMKKTYLTPENWVKDLELEWNFLQSGGLDTGIGSLDDPEDDNPWGSN